MKRAVFLGLIVVFISGCKEPDTTAPVIEMVDLAPAPATAMVCGEPEDNVVTLNSTQTLDFSFRLTDDEGLSQYKIDLHNNFDCHGHAGKVETTDWYVIDIQDVSGTDQTVQHQIPVPVDVTSGTYHFGIQATDAAGNNAESAIYSLNVTNSSDAEVPVLAVVEPSTQSFSVAKGTDINFQGSLTDNNPLGEGTNGRMEVVFWQANQSVADLYEDEFDNSIGETYNFNFDATVPVTTVDGTYTFEVRAFDAVNNPSNTVQFTVEVN